jgi:hypothetical protein
MITVLPRCLLACSDWTAHGSPTIEWSTLQSVGGTLLAERLAEWQVRYPYAWVRRVVVPDRAASHLVMRSESAQLVATAVTVEAGSRYAIGLGKLRRGAVGSDRP